MEQAVYGIHTTYALHMADRHEIFTALVDGAATAEEVAKSLELDTETLHRLLILLCAAGLVERLPNGAYTVPGDIVPFVDRRSRKYLGGFVTHMVTSAAGRMPVLGDHLRHGKSAADPTDADPFARIYADASSTREFLSAMWALSADVSVELVDLAGLTGTRHLVDVGGASGAFAVAALQAVPGLRATVFDLPQVGPYLAETAERHGVADRLGFVAGDFFGDGELPAGDCLALGYVLSDWTDETCLDLLRKVHRACTPGGRVLILERLFDDDRTGPLGTAAMHLSMHVETLGGHRTAAEYLSLLDRAGFTDGRVRRSSQEKHLLIANKE
ncbi:methyltransferase [Nonomuraea angiospora]|uniref:methyltransferase n=1 Tax=Nonomuraea angiospora TaxID=46172 RepID=UPI00342E117B